MTKEISRMLAPTKGIGLAAFALMLCGVANAATTINFDTLNNNDLLTNQFAASGVVFTGLTVSNNTFGGAVVIPSAPNYIYITSPTATVTFKVGGVDAVTDNFSFNLPGLVNGPGCYGGANVSVLGIGGNVLAGGFIAAVNPNSGGVAVTPFGGAFPGTHSIQFTYVPNGNCPGGGLLSLDDLSFNAPVVPAPATLTKNFVPGTIAVNGTSALSFTLTNPSTTAGTNTTLTGLAFSDTLPNDVVVFTPNGLTGNCGGGTITAVAGSNSIGLVGASLAPSASCTFSVNVTAPSTGLKNNTTSTVASKEAAPGNPAKATLTVVVPPQITKAFAVPLLGLGKTTALTFNITNPAGNPVSLTGIAFTDTLPAGLIVSTPNGLAGGCGGGSIIAVQGTNLIQLTGATLASGATCTFSVNVTSIANGLQTNTTSAVTALNGIVIGNKATAIINVADPLLISYAANLGAGQSVIDITNAGTNGGNDKTDYVCANVYVFAEDQQLISCCTCDLSPNDLQTLSVQNDLINNTLTPGVPIGVTVAILASDDTGHKGACNASTVGINNLVSGLRAWGTKLHAAPGGGFAVTEVPFSQAVLSPSEFNKMTSFCGFIQADGSKYGICNSCKPGAQGAKKQ